MKEKNREDVALICDSAIRDTTNDLQENGKEWV